MSDTWSTHFLPSPKRPYISINWLSIHAFTIPINILLYVFPFILRLMTIIIVCTFSPLLWYNCTTYALFSLLVPYHFSNIHYTVVLSTTQSYFPLPSPFSASSHPNHRPKLPYYLLTYQMFAFFVIIYNLNSKPLMDQDHLFHQAA